MACNRPNAVLTTTRIRSAVTPRIFAISRSVGVGALSGTPPKPNLIRIVSRSRAGNCESNSSSKSRDRSGLIGSSVGIHWTGPRDPNLPRVITQASATWPPRPIASAVWPDSARPSAWAVGSIGSIGRKTVAVINIEFVDRRDQPAHAFLDQVAVFETLCRSTCRRNGSPSGNGSRSIVPGLLHPRTSPSRTAAVPHPAPGIPRPHIGYCPGAGRSTGRCSDTFSNLGTIPFQAGSVSG
jgi:hypothetical protein